MVLSPRPSCEMRDRYANRMQLSESDKSAIKVFLVIELSDYVDFSQLQRGAEEFGEFGAMNRNMLEVLMFRCDGIERYRDPRDGTFMKAE